MIDYERAKQIALHASESDECLNECKAAFDAGLSLLGPEWGRLSAQDVFGIFRLRAASAKRAGIDVHGIDQMLERVSKRESDETILIFPFVNTSRLYTIFVSESDESFIGCISVPRRFPDPDVDWSTGAAVRREAKKI